MKRKICALLTSLLLLVTCMAQADVLTEWGIPQAISTAADLIQADAVSATVGDVIVSIDEVAYDGVTAHVCYTLKDTKATESFGTLDGGHYLLDGTETDAFAAKKVGWWQDRIQVNGQEYSMPLAGGQSFGSDEPGVVRHYLSIRLDQAGIAYGEAETLGLPITDKDGTDGGYLTVKLSAAAKDKLTLEQQDVSVALGDTAATAVETVFTPIKVYVMVKLAPDAAAVAEQQGVEQVEIDQQASKTPELAGLKVDQMWAAVSINSEWASSTVVADADGKAVEAMMHGFSGPAAIGADMAMFEFTAMDKYPDEMYLAAVGDDGNPDMSKAVRIH